MTDKAKTPALVCIDGPEDEAFPVAITVRSLKGAESSIRFDCIPRTVTELAALQDKANADRQAMLKDETPKAETEADTPAPVSALAAHRDRLRKEAEYIMTIAKGWSLKDEFGVAALEKLEDKYPGVSVSLAVEYGKAVYGQREKN